MRVLFSRTKDYLANLHHPVVVWSDLRPTVAIGGYMIIIISVGTDGLTSDYRERTKTAAKAAANEKAAKVNYNLFRSSENERTKE